MILGHLNLVVGVGNGVVFHVLKAQHVLWKHIFSEMEKHVGVGVIASHVGVGKVTQKTNVWVLN